MTGLRREGKVIGLEPGTETVYANRDAVGPWEDIIFTSHPDGKLAARFRAANRLLSITPEGNLESRTDLGPWELLGHPQPDLVGRAGVVLMIDGPLPTTGAVLPEVRGKDFFRDGKRISLCGCDGFMDYRLWLDGRE